MNVRWVLSVSRSRSTHPNHAGGDLVQFQRDPSRHRRAPFATSSGPPSLVIEHSCNLSPRSPRLIARFATKLPNAIDNLFLPGPIAIGLPTFTAPRQFRLSNARDAQRNRCHGSIHNACGASDVADRLVRLVGKLTRQLHPSVRRNDLYPELREAMENRLCDDWTWMQPILARDQDKFHVSYKRMLYC